MAAKEATMRKRWLMVVLACVVPMVALAQPAARPARPTMPAWREEVKQAFGFVPSFVSAVPAEAGEAWWLGFRGLWMGETAIPGKYKDLISIAVASQIPCPYCVYADTQFALKLDGASQREVNEAIMMASITRLASTILNGSGQDEGEFRKEADAIFAHVKQQAGKPTPAPVAITDPASALDDMKRTFGLVPSFAKRTPPALQVSLWRLMKEFQLSPETAIPPRYKELIGLGVAAQIPCKYCMYFHREAARLNGATQAELDEAIAIAGDTRASSALIFGAQVDQARFKKEIDQAIRHLQKAARTAAVTAPAR